jgi:hypothetical protein
MLEGGILGLDLNNLERICYHLSHGFTPKANEDFTQQHCQHRPLTPKANTTANNQQHHRNRAIQP